MRTFRFEGYIVSMLSSIKRKIEIGKNLLLHISIRKMILIIFCDRQCCFSCIGICQTMRPSFDLIDSLQSSSAIRIASCLKFTGNFEDVLGEIFGEILGKIFGESWSGKQYMITSLHRSPGTLKFEAREL